jgi:modulator of FtsH protease HflC
MRWKLPLIVALLAAVIVAPSTLFTVDRTEFVYLTQFGRRVAVFDGASADQAGLHFKWPWPVQAVQRLDRRLQAFDFGTEVLTRDPLGNTIDTRLSVDVYVTWRIAGSDGADRFLRSVGSVEEVRRILDQRVTSDLGAAAAEMELRDLFDTDPARVERQRDRLADRLLNGGAPSLRETALGEYGIEVVDVRLRRANHPPAVRDAIFARIRSERDKKVAEHESEGKRLADDILSSADREVREMRARAEGEAIRLRGNANAAADRIRSDAQAKDPQFYAFLKKLEEYQRILGDNKTMLLLSTHRELFDLLFSPPEPYKPAKPSAGKDK